MAPRNDRLPLNNLEDLLKQSKNISADDELADKVIEDIKKRHYRASVVHVSIYVGLGLSAVAMIVFISTMITQISGSSVIDLVALGVAGGSELGVSGLIDVTLAVAEALPIEAIALSLLSIFVFLVLLRATLGILRHENHEFRIRAT